MANKRILPAVPVTAEAQALLLWWVVVDESQRESLLPGKVGGDHPLAPVSWLPLLCEQGKLWVKCLVPEFLGCLRFTRLKRPPRLPQTLMAVAAGAELPQVQSFPSSSSGRLSD